MIITQTSLLLNRKKIEKENFYYVPLDLQELHYSGKSESYISQYGDSSVVSLWIYAEGLIASKRKEDVYRYRHTLGGIDDEFPGAIIFIANGIHVHCTQKIWILHS